MKTYIETQEGSYTIDSMSIPNSNSNRHYRQMIDEVANGLAVVELFDHSANAHRELVESERAWRNSELVRTDIELSKVREGASKAVGTEQDWVDYRNALRDYPEQEDFPNVLRPVSP